MLDDLIEAICKSHDFMMSHWEQTINFMAFYESEEYNQIFIDFAGEIGKDLDDLTGLERQQAFLNWILSEDD